MTVQWSGVAPAVSDIIILGAALYILSGKLNWEDRWKALVPGLRMFELGKSLKLYRDGMICGVVDVVYTMVLLINIVVSAADYDKMVTLLQLILYVYVFIYRLLLFLELLKLFDLSRKWVIPYIIVQWLPLMIIGLGEKYQPHSEHIREESWVAGARPGHTGGGLCEAVPLVDEGLSVQIRERTVRSGGKKRYLLKDIALNIPRNNLVLLLGGSGAGKTTMMNAVIGYEQADATILLNGDDVYKQYDKLKHNIGYVPQQNLIRGKDSVIRTIDDAARIRLPKTVTPEEKKKRIEEVMTLLGLTAGEKGLVAKKSGGQLRRICIAMELATDPDLFVLDEPDSGLDGAIAREIFTKLRHIADEGRVVIVITHTPDRVIEFFDKVIVLARDSGRVGRLAFYGSPQEARDFFGRETMEEIVRSVNGKDEGGEGLADEMIEKYAAGVISKGEEERQDD